MLLKKIMYSDYGGGKINDLIQSFCQIIMKLFMWSNNYEVIYVIKTVMKYYLKKIDTSFHQCLPNMIQRLFADVITWRDLVYEYSWGKSLMISGNLIKISSTHCDQKKGASA